MTAMLKIMGLLLIALMICMPALSVPCDDEDEHDESGRPFIIINTTGDVNLGDIIRNSAKTVFPNEQIIKFEIKCSRNSHIHIMKLDGVTDPDVSFTTEWKAGPETGFENDFTDGLYKPEHKRFYVTVKVKILRASAAALSGRHRISPGIRVEYMHP